MCQILDVSRSRYYAWKERPPSEKTKADAALTERITEIQQRSRETHGATRSHAELRFEGIRCGRKQVAMLMRQAGISGFRWLIPPDVSLSAAEVIT